jgi:hypothetical protein
VREEAICKKFYAIVVKENLMWVKECTKLQKDCRVCKKEDKTLIKDGIMGLRAGNNLSVWRGNL